MNILFATSEASPFIKSGGLGDVMGSLPKTLAGMKNNNICVFLPYYSSVKSKVGAEFVLSINVPLAWRSVYAGIFRKKLSGVTYYFIDNNYYFGRDCYGYHDDGERFAFFDKAVLEAISYIDFAPDIIHLNDWQTGFIPLFLKAHYMHLEKYRGIKTVFTIHNIEYQGKANPDFLTDVLGVDEKWRGCAEHYGMINAAKAGIVLADKVTTVSSTYAHEIRHAYFACGLENVINENAYKLSGIVNGIDNELFNPETDKNIPVSYSAASASLKEENKKALRGMLGLNDEINVPVVAIISRLVAHKGMELFEQIWGELLKLDIQLVVIGTGEKRFEDLFRFLEYTYPGKVSANIMFDTSRASFVYSGADFLMMPSKSEPCGLSQLIAMRYGTIPVVRETGGLVDTVVPIDTGNLEGTGFTFKTYTGQDMLDAVRRATEFYSKKDKLQYIRRKIMMLDNGWIKSAGKYMQLYDEMLKEVD